MIKYWCNIESNLCAVHLWISWACFWYCDMLDQCIPLSFLLGCFLGYYIVKCQPVQFVYYPVISISCFYYVVQFFFLVATWCMLPLQFGKCTYFVYLWFLFMSSVCLHFAVILKITIFGGLYRLYGLNVVFYLVCSQLLNTSWSHPICLLDFINCFLKCCCVFTGVLLTCLIFLIIMHPVFGKLYPVWSANVVGVTMIDYGATGPGSTIFMLDGYCRPCSHNRRFFGRLICFFIVPFWQILNALW